MGALQTLVESGQKCGRTLSGKTDQVRVGHLPVSLDTLQADLGIGTRVGPEVIAASASQCAEHLLGRVCPLARSA